MKPLFMGALFLLLAGSSVDQLHVVHHPDFSGIPVLTPRIHPAAPAGFTEKPFVDSSPAPQPTPEEQERGYLVFSRTITEPIHRHVHPLARERITRLTSFATPGEYEPLTFSVYPFRNIDRFRVKVSSLQAADGAVIPRHNLKLRGVTFWNIRYPRYTSSGAYRAQPELLERFTSINLKSGQCQRFWITVHVPLNARPGLYKGMVTLYETGREAGIGLPIRFRVLGYRLQKDPAKRYSVYYSHQSYMFPGLAGTSLVRAQDNELNAMRAHGLDMFPVMRLRVDKDQNGHLRIHILDEQYLEKMVQAGFRGPIPIAGSIRRFYNEFVPEGTIGEHWNISIMPPNDDIYSSIEQAYRGLKQEAEAHGWPEFICCPLDEVSPASAEFGAKVFAAVRRSGIRTYITKDPTGRDAAVYRQYDGVDVWCSQPFAIPYSKVIADQRYQYWTYPNHNATEIKNMVIMQKGGRMTYGYGLWRSGYTGVIPWHWRWRDPDHPFDYLYNDHHSGSGMRMDEQQEIIPAVYWECFREGYDDLRYLYTLQQAIIQRQGSNDPGCLALVDAGKQLIQELWNGIIPQTTYLNTGMWTDRTFRFRRWQIADLTGRLLGYPASNNDQSPSVLADPASAPLPENDADFISDHLEQGDVDQVDLAANEYGNWYPSGDPEVSLNVNHDQSPVTMQFNVLVNHTIGEPGYPINWPRIAHDFADGEIDLTRYDYLFFRIRVDSNRSEVADDYTPFGVNFSSYEDGVTYDYQVDLGDRQRVWIPVIISIKEMMDRSGFTRLNWSRFKRLQLVVSESSYEDGTRLEFEIGDIALIRFDQPVLHRIICDDLILRGTRFLPVKVQGYGLEETAGLGYSWKAVLLDSSGREVLVCNQSIADGKEIVFEPAALSVGSYRLKLMVTDSGGRVLSTVEKVLQIINGFD